MLADIGGRHKPFRSGNIVIFNINNFESASDIRIIVNKVGKGNDKADNLLRHEISGCCLCAENISVRNIISVWVRLNFKIFCNNLEGIEVLTFIFMKALHLNVKDRGRVKLNSGFLFNESGKVFLVMKLNFSERFKNSLVILIFIKLGKLRGIGDKAFADKTFNEL